MQSDYFMKLRDIKKSLYMIYFVNKFRIKTPRWQIICSLFFFCPAFSQLKSIKWFKWIFWIMNCHIWKFQITITLFFYFFITFLNMFLIKFPRWQLSVIFFPHLKRENDLSGPPGSWTQSYLIYLYCGPEKEWE